MTAPERALRTDRADALCASAWAAALGERPEQGLALVAVGGYGRAELAPHSDLDVVLVHEPGVEVADVARRLWYPMWDSGLQVDHAVRGLDEVRAVARDDVRVALGLVDVRHLAGDTAVSLQLRADVLAGWRRHAPENLPRLRGWVQERASSRGELAHAAVPDLKESAGGLRDAAVLKGLVATWLVDVPHTELERCRRELLDVRDVVHALVGRASDRVTPELWSPLAIRLGLDGEREAQRLVRSLGRRMTHLSRLTWRRVDGVTDPAPRSRHGHGPLLEIVSPGVAIAAGEVVLAPGARPADDPSLLLRAATEASERDLPLAPTSVARLTRESPPMPEPWPDEARTLLVRLLAGRGLVQVWETLDELGAVPLVLPEWNRVRLLPHASAIHRFTVDRHVLETCVEAGRLIRRVARPDLLLVAALLHDIGKGEETEHSLTGEPIARTVAARWGFTENDVAVIGTLVRHHLLLPRVATTRDLDEPVTADEVGACLGDRVVLDLLQVLTEADARATSPQAWTSWRAGLVGELAARVRRSLAGMPPPPPQLAGHQAVERIEISRARGGVVVRVSEPDRPGLLADVAAALAAARLPVVSARAGTRDGVSTSAWLVGRHEVEPTSLRRRVSAALEGNTPSVPSPVVGSDGLPPDVVVAEVATDAAVMEVRAQDRPGVLHAVLRSLSAGDLCVRSAHVGSVGPQVVDVFYLQRRDGSEPGRDLVEQSVEAVRRALSPAATLDA
jgi:[protein-PII] uridylyltransferase